jgi:hypothetical protein
MDTATLKDTLLQARLVQPVQREAQLETLEVNSKNSSLSKHGGFVQGERPCW